MPASFASAFTSTGALAAGDAVAGEKLYTVASLFCGMAQSMEQLVLARVLQGVGAR